MSRLFFKRQVCECVRMSRPRTRASRATGVGCLLAMLGTGCSFIFAEGPPPNHREVRYFDCTSSYGPPAADTVVSVFGGLTAATLLVLSGLSDSGDRSDRVALVSLPLVMLPVSSAIYGYTQVGSCRKAQSELAMRLMHPQGIESLKRPPREPPPASPSPTATPPPAQFTPPSTANAPPSPAPPSGSPAPLP